MRQHPNKTTSAGAISCCANFLNTGRTPKHGTWSPFRAVLRDGDGQLPFLKSCGTCRGTCGNTRLALLMTPRIIRDWHTSMRCNDKWKRFLKKEVKASFLGASDYFPKAWRGSLTAPRRTCDNGSPRFGWHANAQPALWLMLLPLFEQGGLCLRNGLNPDRCGVGLASVWDNKGCCECGSGDLGTGNANGNANMGTHMGNQNQGKAHVFCSRGRVVKCARAPSLWQALKPATGSH